LLNHPATFRNARDQFEAAISKIVVPIDEIVEEVSKGTAIANGSFSSRLPTGNQREILCVRDYDGHSHGKRNFIAKSFLLLLEEAVWVLIDVVSVISIVCTVQIDCN